MLCAPQTRPLSGYRTGVFFHVRTSPNAAPADAILRDIFRREIRLAAPGVPVFSVKTLRQHVDNSPQLWIVQSAATVVSIFAGLALVLAMVGVYGVMAYAVVRRTREIGIRTAPGAKPGAVLRMIVREGLARNPLRLTHAAFGIIT